MLLTKVKRKNPLKRTINFLPKEFVQCKARGKKIVQKRKAITLLLEEFIYFTAMGKK